MGKVNDLLISMQEYNENKGEDIMIDVQKFAEDLNELVNDELIIRIGNYVGDYCVGDGGFEKISGELFVMTKSHNLFRVVSDDSSVYDDFDVIGSEAIVTPIDKDLENGNLSYEDVDVYNKSSIRGYLPKDDVGMEMFECVQSVPPRFRCDALELFDFADDREMWDMRTVDKAWTYFLDDVVGEMTDDERLKYGF